jgi:S1-C subfamily serine protease/regulation of enolase protein 1 (concanavalin A-like superfamily)
MATTFVCPQCGHAGKLPDGFQGSRVRCPACKVISPFVAGGHAKSSAIPHTDAPRAEPKPAIVPQPKPVRQHKKPVERAVQVPMGIVLGSVAAAALVFGGLGIGVALLFAHMSEKAQPEIAKSIPQDPRDVASQAAAAHLSKRLAVADDSANGPSNHDAPAQGPGPFDDGTSSTPGQAPPLAGLANPGQTSVAAVPHTGSRTSAGSANPQPSSPLDAVPRIEDATVFIKVQSGLRRSSGSGFVIQSQADTVLVATNHHVVSSHPDGPPEHDAAPGGAIAPAVTVVFRSGSGPGVEQSLRASVIADDGDDNHDLAILEVRGVKNPPQPIDPFNAPEPTITMPVLIYGFPFGNIDQQLDPSIRRNPSITVNRGSVSSLKRDQFNQLAHIQIDGSLNPGNSGGPVVDEKGRLVGVSVAGYAGTIIGFAIPCAELTRVLDGRLGALKLGMQGESGGQANMQVEVNLIDPRQRIRSVDFLFAPAAKMSASAGPDSEGNWPRLRDAQIVNLGVRGATASGGFRAAVKSPDDRRLVVQASYRLANGKIVYTHPTPYEIPTRRTILTRAAALPRNSSPLATFAVLGPLTDPLQNSVKDCHVRRDASSMTIEVPAGVRLLSLPLEIKNAPMTLADVEGDFVARVRVGGTLLPGMERPRYKGKDVLPGTFQGAGLVLWKDTKNYIRVERTARTERGRPNLDSEALLEIVTNDKMVVRAYPKIPDQPLYLLIQRRGGSIDCMFSIDGVRWASHPKLAVTFPAKVKVGLVACNASKRIFTAQFEQFVLATEKRQEDEAAPP